MPSSAPALVVLLLLTSTIASPLAKRQMNCPPNFRNNVFNTGAAKNPGWPGTFDTLLQNGVSNWIGFTDRSIESTPNYDPSQGVSAAGTPELDAAQIPICMDPTFVNDCISLLTSCSPPQYMELFNEPDFSFDGYTPLTDAQAAAAALAPLLAAKTSTQFITPALAFSNSGYLSQFNDACNNCIIDNNMIVSMHVYNVDPNVVIQTIEQTHSTWPNQRIWVTELAPASASDQNCTYDQSGMINWMQTVIPQILQLGYVDRIFWNSGEYGTLYSDPNAAECNPSLTNPDGSVTPLLQAYSQICQ